MIESECPFFQLILRDNAIGEVPKDLFKCVKLKALHIQTNQINILPPDMSKSHWYIAI